MVGNFEVRNLNTVDPSENLMILRLVMVAEQL